jgi:hypothetical protein
MSKRKYSSRDEDDFEMPLAKKFNKMSYKDADDGYETDATIIDEEYDPEEERQFYMTNSPVQAPRTPPQRMYGPEPATELVDKNGEPLYLQSSDTSDQIPYTTHHLRQQYPATNTFGRFEDLSEYTLAEPNDNVGGSSRKSRRGRRTIKRKYKKSLASRKRKSFRRKYTTKRRGKTRRKMKR